MIIWRQEQKQEKIELEKLLDKESKMRNRKVNSTSRKNKHKQRNDGERAVYTKNDITNSG